MKGFKKVSIIVCLALVITAMLSTVAMAAELDSTAPAAKGSGNSWDFIYGDYDPWGDSKPDTSTVKFYIQMTGEQMDLNGDISGRDTLFFTDSVAQTTVAKTIDSDFKKTWDDNSSDGDIKDYVKELPKQKNVLKQVVDTYEAKDAYIRSTDGKIIPWSKMTTDYYRIHWYVLKLEECWHIDGVIIDRSTDKEINIVVPDEKTERASCVEYDVKAGTFTPGVMEVMANRPHSYWSGDNDTLIIDGFNDVWYTVLNESTFKANKHVIPSKLIDAATAINKLAAARLSELNESLQKQYGRIDSQAYKQEYVERTGSGKTLYVTPFITEMLSSKYGVNTDEYVWLAMGDAKGNINKVYVMDRKLADIDNLFDGE